MNDSFAGLIGLVLMVGSFAAWLTHIITCLADDKWGFLIAGAIDYQKKSKYNISKLNLLNDNYQVTFLGYVSNMINIYNKTAIVCLPSYREGFSKTLQEAAAKGLPIITTDVVGCKDAIIPGYTGLICKPKSSK